MNVKRDYKSFDFILLILVCTLVIFGIIVIGSATRINIPDTVTSQYSAQQLWFISGLLLLLLSAFIDYQFICKFYIPIYFFNILLLIIVLFMPNNTSSTDRWLNIGGFGIQPSEFSKIFIILFLSKFVDKKNESINNFFVLSFVLMALAIPTYLIKEQPSLSSTLVVVVIFVSILFVGKLSYKYILIAALVLIPLGILIYVDIYRETPLFINKFLEDYQFRRFTEASAQTRNSIYAIGSGQFYGKGLYHGTFTRLSYLAESHNDFIFAVIGEEFGFFGCVGVLTLMFLIIIKCLFIAQKSTLFLGKLIASGVAAMFAFQSFVNVGVATGFLVNTGMPFPFVSYGGSSMWINMIAIGLVINVGMTKPKSMFEG